MTIYKQYSTHKPTHQDLEQYRRDLEAETNADISQNDVVRILLKNAPDPSEVHAK